MKRPTDIAVAGMKGDSRYVPGGQRGGLYLIPERHVVRDRVDCSHDKSLHNRGRDNVLMRLFFITGLFLVLVIGSVEVCRAGSDGFPVTKEPELQQIRPKKPVKIRLKRSAKDGYTWELAGDDVDEIIRTDRKLKKQLNIP